MALSALQRDFLTNNLGVKPGRGKLDLKGKVTDSRLSGAVDAYLVEEDAILKQIAAIRGIAGAEPFVLNLERAMSDVQKGMKAARRTDGVDAVKTETKTVAGLRKTAQQVIDNRDFYVALDAQEKELEALREDPHRAHVKPETDKADADLKEARKLAGDNKFKEARASLADGAGACAEGRRCVTEYAPVIVLKGSAARLLASMKGMYANENTWKTFSTSIDAAGLKAETPTRNYAAAATELGTAVTGMKGHMTAWWVTKEPKGLAELNAKKATLAGKSKDGTTVIDADLAAIAQVRQKIADAVAASKWPVAALAATKELPDLVIDATKRANRRIEYDKQRETSTASVQTLKDSPALLGQMFSLSKLVEKADGLASRESMRFEDGIAQLKEVAATATLLKTTHADSQAYAEKRLVAEDRLETIRKAPAARAGMIDDQLAYAGQLMAEAEKSTGAIDLQKVIATGPDMEDRRMAQVDWAHARTTVEQAIAALAAAGKLAEDMKASTEMAGRAGAADSGPMIAKVAGDIRRQGEAVRSKPHGDKAASILEDLGTTLDEALREAKAEGRLSAAQELIQAAASLLLGAQTTQAQYNQFAADRALADGRQKALLGSTVPPAATLEPHTDEAAGLLAAAQTAADRSEWQKASEFLRAATAVLARAEEAAERRRTFDAAALPLRNGLSALAEPLKGQVGEMVAKAEQSAAASDFVLATRHLALATARLAGDKVKKKAVAGDVGPEFEQEVEKMLAAVGGEELFAKPTDNPSGDRATRNGPELLDELVRNLPDGVAPKVIIAIAKKRFGIDLSLSALRWDSGKIVDDKNAPADAIEPNSLKDLSKRTKSAKKIYEMLALTPEQSANNPSLRKVMREDVLKNIKLDALTGNNTYDLASGGYYQGSDNLTSMSGRPGDTMQKFGSKQHGYKKDRTGTIQKDNQGKSIQVDMLPPRAGPEFAPANEDDVDYFDFANVHETGHAVDDRMGFMASRAGQANFGGWITHGSDIAAIAKQVARKYGGDQAGTVEQFAADVMIGAKVEPPAVGPSDQAIVNAACADIREWFDYATKTSPWWSQEISARLALDDGRVYQEAYPGTWVSYPLAERAKGLTGYQFRAPGEWFAELYAGYHLGKLKPGHPARKWLSSLSL